MGVKIFYVYVLQDGQDVFYVGKGHRNTVNGYDRVRLYYQNFQRNLRQQAVWDRVRCAQNFTHRILEDNLTEPQAFERERFWVTQFDGLVNQTGGGHSGWTLSAESRRKMSLARKGKKQGPRSEEAKKRMSLAKLGKPASMKNRKAISKGNLKRWARPGERERLSESMRNSTKKIGRPRKDGRCEAGSSRISD